MRDSQNLKKYGMFLAGLIFSALGVSLITKAGLGTSPVTSLAFVLTFIFPKSLGTFTFLVNFCMFFMEALILGKRFRRFQFLQIPATFIFSACIDMWMSLFSHVDLRFYPVHVMVLLCGCASLGFGIALEVIPDVLILPGEGLVKAISTRWNLNFGHVKTVFDLSLVASAALTSLLCKGTILGIREGTIVAAMIVGTISHFCIRRIRSFLAKQKSLPGELLETEFPLSADLTEGPQGISAEIVPFP